jgi:uncharacterized membrane protein YidH (DUF202 family)
MFGYDNVKYGPTLCLCYRYTVDRKKKLTKTILIIGSFLVVVGIVIWVINFFGIYADAGLNSLCGGLTCASDVNKFNKQATLRGIGEIIILIGVLSLFSGLLLRTRTKKK